MHFFSETWTSNVWTMITMMIISKLRQHNQFPTRSANQSTSYLESCKLEHHQCIRLLKAVCGLVDAPRRWYHRVATDLRNLTGEVLCAWFMSMISCWHAVTLYLENMYLKALTICTSAESGSHECSNSVAHKSLKNMVWI